MSKRATLEIDTPDVRCTGCGFTTGLSGQWSVEAGRLVFRADADPLQSRGPDFGGCSEGGHPITGVTFAYGQEPLTDVEFAELRATAAA